MEILISFFQTNFTLFDTTIGAIAQVKNRGVIFLHSLLSLTSTLIPSAIPICSSLLKSLYHRFL